LEDVGRLLWVAVIITKARELVNFITNHHASLAIYRKQTPKALLKPGETRFGTFFLMLDRLCEVKDALEEMLVHSSWRQWANSRGQHEAGAIKAKQLIRDDEFWEQATLLVNVTK
jgi:hypothetical protein